MAKQQPKKTKTRWHRMLGRLLKELLTPTGITVLTDVPVMSEPPEADILLLRREKHKNWTKEQKARLPDGIRDSHAKHVLLEFKYSESINEKVFRQTICYDYLYLSGQKMKDNEVQTFIISSKTPRESTLQEFAYFPAGKQGVYHSKNTFLKNIPLILLNELSNEPYNAWIKCFASKKKEKKSAFNTLKRISFLFFNSDLNYIIEGLLCYWLKIGGQPMSTELTPEKIMEYGKQWHNFVLAGLKPKERLAGLKPKERLAGLKPKERLAGLKPEEIDELEKYLKELKKKKKI